MNLELPAEVVEALGPEPEREVLEGVLLLPAPFLRALANSDSKASTSKK